MDQFEKDVHDIADALRPESKRAVLLDGFLGCLGYLILLGLIVLAYVFLK